MQLEKTAEVESIYVSTHVVVIRKQSVMPTRAKLPMSGANSLVPTLERAQVVILFTPPTTRVPTMKRGRSHSLILNSHIKQLNWRT